MPIISGNIGEPPKEETVVEMTRHNYFILRLRELGLYERDSEYEGMIGRAVEELSNVFRKQAHSGASASITVKIFNMLMEEWENPSVVKEKPTRTKKIKLDK